MTVADRQIKNINKISILILDGAHNTPDGVFFRKVSRRGERVNDLDRRKVLPWKENQSGRDYFEMIISLKTVPVYCDKK